MTKKDPLDLYADTVNKVLQTFGRISSHTQGTVNSLRRTVAALRSMSSSRRPIDCRDGGADS